MEGVGFVERGSGVGGEVAWEAFVRKGEEW